MLALLIDIVIIAEIVVIVATVATVNPFVFDNLLIFCFVFGIVVFVVVVLFVAITIANYD